MPKISESQLSRMKRFIREFGDILTIQTDEKTKSQVLYCQCCHCVVNSDQKSHVNQHLKTSNHRTKIKDFKSKQISVQKLFTNSQKEFNADLCEFLVSLNIPFHRLLNPGMKKFFDKYTKYSVPKPSTLWIEELKPMYEKTIENIRDQMKDKYIWLQIYESTDQMKRKVANVIVGSLDPNQEKMVKFLIEVKFLKKTNSSSIAQCVNDALSILWPDGIKYERLLLLVTDAAPYMKAAGRTLCDLYPKLTHVTCVAHGLHNVCEYLMVQYKDVNRLISCGKKVFKKAPNRIELFNEMHPNLPLPPEPITTRWGLWLQGVEYYAKYFSEFYDVIQQLDSEESPYIEEAQELIKSPTIKNDIAFIYSNFNCLSTALSQLQETNLTLNESLSIIDSVYSKLESAVGVKSQLIFKKLKNVFAKNEGLSRIRGIFDILNGKNNVEIGIDLSPEEIASFESCPITDCDIERSFSKFNFILSDKRLSFKEENLKQYIIINCFHN